MRRMNGDRAAWGGFVAAVALLAFLAGAFAAITEIFPYGPLHRAWRAGAALYIQQTEYASPYGTDLWHEARTDARGVTAHDPDQAAGGYTLFTAGDGPYARLIDMEGRVVHEWRRPFSSVWDERSPVRSPRPDEFVYLRKARVLPNGDLLAIYAASGDTPWGYGMVRLDRDSGLRWYYPGRTHHDFDVAADGRIYALTHELAPAGRLDHLDDPFLEDSLVILSADGEELERVSLTRALASSRYHTLLHATPHYAASDPLHTNSVQRLSAAEAGAIPNAEAGDVLLSFRELGVLAVLDVERGRIAWATRGPWLDQHDPGVLANERVLLFDNRGAFRPENSSRVLEVDPRSHAVTWEYRAPPEAPLESRIRGAAERLRNGNTLITESSGGRLLEVTPDGEIVWEYVHPVRGGDGGQYIPAVSWGQRIEPAALSRAFRRTLARR